MLAFELWLQYACIKTVEQRLSEQTLKGDLVHRALTTERLIAKLDYNFWRKEIPNHLQEGPSGHQHFKDSFYQLFIHSH